MKKILYPVFIAAVMFITGCGNSFYQAQDYFTGPVDGVGLKSTTTLVSGGSEQLSAVVSPPKTSNKSVTWASSNSSIVSVDSNGQATAVASVMHGETKSAVITVTTHEGGFSAQCTVTVVEKPVPVTGVTLNKGTSYLLTGNSEALTAIITPSTATNQNLTWSSSNSLIASVNSSGVVTTGTNTGQTMITVTTSDGGFTASCLFTVTLTPVSVTGVTLNKSATVIAAGNSEMLFAIITPSNATNQNITWSSDNAGVATVDAFGNVTGQASGLANITATTADGGYSDSCAVSVVTSPVPVTGVSLSQSTITIQVGNQGQLTAAITPANATNQNLIWNTSNSLIASVNSSGVVTGNAVGSATITVTTQDGGYSAACSVTITNAVTYSVIFNPNGGSGTPPAAQSYLPGTIVVVINSGSLTMSGYSFTGWNTSSNGSGTTYTPGSTFTMGSADVTLYAMWAIYYTAPTGLSYSTPSALYTIGTAITNNVPTVTGTVTSWSISPALPAGLNFNTGNGVISGTPASQHDSTLYTIFAANTGGSATVSIMITVKLNAPTGVLLSSGMFGGFSVSWTAVTGATYYEVYYNTTYDTLTATLASGSISTTIYDLNGLSGETVYYVWVKAKNSSSTSDFSTVAVGITP